jgi:tetratricopeptide (TPR) repeat protein
LIAERESAADAGALIAAVEVLSRRLRERIGESLVTVRESPSLERVTTASLPALRAYSEGARLYTSGRGNQAAMPHLEQAVALDSSFGMAWRLIGVLYRNRDEPGRAVDAMRRAYALRDKMPPQEAAHVTAIYREIVDDDPAAAAEAYERLLSSWPDDIRAINNLAVQFGILHRERDAVRLYRQALELRPNTALYLGNLLQSLVRLDDLSGADSLLGMWAKADSAPGGALLYYRIRLAGEEGDFARVDAITDSVTRARQVARFSPADLLLRQGRLREAMPRLDPPEAALVDGILRGNPDRARQALGRLEASFRWDSVSVSDRPYGPAALAWSLLGAPDRADALLASQAREVQPEVLRRDRDRGHALGLVALLRGRPQDALDGLRQVHCDVCTAFHEGQAFEALGQPDSAIAQYERFVNSHNTDPENREWFLAAGLRRLGEMYESKGDRAKAVEYYGRFVDLWKNADPEFQPLVSDIRKHMAELAGEPPR